MSKLDLEFQEIETYKDIEEARYSIRSLGLIIERYCLNRESSNYQYLIKENFLNTDLSVEEIKRIIHFLFYIGLKEIKLSEAAVWSLGKGYSFPNLILTGLFNLFNLYALVKRNDIITSQILIAYLGLYEEFSPLDVEMKVKYFEGKLNKKEFPISYEYIQEQLELW